MKLVYHPNLSSHLESYGISVPLRDDRSHRTYEALRQEFPGRLDLASIENWRPLGKEELELAHSKQFVDSLFESSESEQKIIECFELVDNEGRPNRFNPDLAKKPLSEMVEDILMQARGSIESMKLSLDHQMCFFLGGGMHHAMEDGGRGFCLVNDIVVGIRSLQRSEKIQNAWVIDTDAHKGDGTAALCSKDNSIHTLSIHMEKGWPLDVGSGDGPWRIPSTIDIAIPFKGESEYLDRLEMGLIQMNENFSEGVGLAVVVAGADPFEKDALLSSNKLRLNLEQMLERDKLVYNFLKDKNIPQCWLMAGGYGPDSWEVYTQFISSLMREAE